MSECLNLLQSNVYKKANQTPLDLLFNNGFEISGGKYNIELINFI